MKLDKEYDLKKSQKLVGQLYPVIKDKAGNVIDGVHRSESDPNWRTEILPEIDTKEKFLAARCVANWHRRTVKRWEKEEWINGLAEIYKKQGLKVRRIKGSTRLNEIVNKIVEVIGLDVTTVRDYISPEFKQMETGRKIQEPRVPASQVIEKAFKQRDYGRKLVERHREEVKEKLKSDVDFVSSIVEKHPEVVSKAIMKVAETVKPEAVYIPPAEAEKIKERGKDLEEETQRLNADPKIQLRRRLFQNLTRLQQIVMFATDTVCPNCGASHENLAWKCCNLTPEEALDKAHEKMEATK